MVSKNQDKIDFDKLELELALAVEADAKYNRENDAKFRAVHQKVATYEEFRDIVAASHLKPLDKGDKIGQRFIQPWNALGTHIKTEDGIEQQNISCEQNFKKIECKVLSTGYQFIQIWKKCKSSKERYQLLLDTGASKLGFIFSTEIGCSLLVDFVSVLGENYDSLSSREILAILDALSRVKRFALNIEFMSGAEKKTCRELFSKLENTFTEAASNDQNCGTEGVNMNETLNDTMKRYGM